MGMHGRLSYSLPSTRTRPPAGIRTAAEARVVNMERTGVAILGAGFSGLCMAIRLKQSNRDDFVVFEAAPEVGGTWRDNIYPGCACDIPSHLYSYSFAPTRNWSRVYAPQSDIWAYLKDCVQRFDIGDHIMCNTKIVEAVYDAEQGAWRLTSEDGRCFLSAVTVVATGGLTTPSCPKVPGLSSFNGHVSHSAAWDPSYDFTGKRVAVVGTGASAVQVVPALQPLVKQLVVFQRTPAWVTPKHDGPWSEERRAAWWFPTWLAIRRGVTYMFNELVVGRVVVGNDRKLGAAIEQQVHDEIKKHIKDPKLQVALTPNYRIGCKRICQSSDFYPAIAQPNVTLVAAALAQVEDGNVVVGADGSRHEVDAIVFATGFQVGASWVALKVIGTDGRQLQQEWAQKQAAYLGVAVSGYPNFFAVLGPNSGLGHNSMVVMIECQVNYILKVLQWMQASKLKAVEVMADAVAALSERVQQRLQTTVWLSGCQTWYLQQVGTGNATADSDSSSKQQQKLKRVETYILWPWSTIRYWWQTLWVRKADWSVVPMKEAGPQQQQLPGACCKLLAKEE